MRERRSSRPGAEAKPLPAELDVPSSSSMTMRDTDESRQQKRTRFAKRYTGDAFAKWVHRRCSTLLKINARVRYDWDAFTYILCNPCGF